MPADAPRPADERKFERPSAAQRCELCFAMAANGAEGGAPSVADTVNAHGRTFRQVSANAIAEPPAGAGLSEP